MLRIATSWRCGRGRGFRVTGVWWRRVMRLVMGVVGRMLMRVVFDGGQQPVQPHAVLLGQQAQLVKLLLNFGQAPQGLTKKGREAGHVDRAVAVRRRCCGRNEQTRTSVHWPCLLQKKKKKHDKRIVIFRKFVNKRAMHELNEFHVDK